MMAFVQAKDGMTEPGGAGVGVAGGNTPGAYFHTSGLVEKQFYAHTVLTNADGVIL